MNCIPIFVSLFGFKQKKKTKDSAMSYSNPGISNWPWDSGQVPLIFMYLHQVDTNNGYIEPGL